MDKNWTKIYSTGQVYLAEIYKSVLIEKGIECILINKQDSSYLFGEAELYVRVEKAFEAKQMIIKLEKSE